VTPFPVLALRPDPDRARELLSRELSRAEYQPSLWQRLVDWVSGLFDRVSRAADSVGRPGPAVAIVLLVLLAALALLVLSRLRRPAARRDEDAEVFGDGRLGADQHRALAAEALGAEQWDVALVESVRAMAAGLIERDLLPDQPGATAREISERSGQLFPGEQQALSTVAAHFEETVYGDRPADEPRARAAVALEQRVRAATPATGRSSGPVPVAPR
jgi:hypothetical protein